MRDTYAVDYCPYQAVGTFCTNLLQFSQWPYVTLMLAGNSSISSSGEDMAALALKHKQRYLISLSDSSMSLTWIRIRDLVFNKELDSRDSEDRFSCAVCIF